MSNIGLENAKSCLIAVYAARQAPMPSFDLHIYGYNADEVNQQEGLAMKLVEASMKSRGIDLEMVGEWGPARNVKFFGANGRPRL